MLRTNCSRSLVSRHAECGAIRNSIGAAFLAAATLFPANLPAASNIVPISQLEGASNAVSVDGTLACIGSGPNIFVLDATNPKTPERVAQAAFEKTVNGITLSGSMAYVTFGGELQIVDLSVPSKPLLRGSCYLFGDARGVALYGTMACVAAGGAGFKVVDVSSPDSPSVVGSVATTNFAVDVAVSGAYAYVADGTAGLQIISLANPAVPALRGLYNTPGYAHAVRMSGTLAYVADGSGGLAIVNCANPDGPTLTGSYAASSDMGGVALQSGLAYLADATQLTIVDVSTPSAPTLRGQCNVPYRAAAVALAGPVAYLACEGNEFTSVDVTDPAAPVMLGNSGSVGFGLGVALSGNVAYVAGNTGGLRILDVTDPTAPGPLGKLNLFVPATAVDRFGSTVYVATGDGLKMANVADPTAPSLSGTYLPGSQVNDVAVVGSPAAVWGCVTVNGSGMNVVNLTNPAAPLTIGTWPGTGDLLGVAVSGNRAYVAGGYSGLRIIDLANPASPALLGTCDTPGYANDVAVSGSLAFVADELDGLQVVSVANPLAPSIVGNYNTPGYAESLAVSTDNDLVFVADGEFGLEIVDVSDPTNPVLWGASGTLAGFTYGVALSPDGEFVVLASGDAGIYIAGNRAMREEVDDTFPTGAIQPPGAASGWSSFGYSGPMGWPDYDASKHAYQAYVVADSTRYRNPGVISNIEEWLPFNAVKASHFVRAKCYVYAAGQTNPADGNEIPNMRLRLQTRFAVNSMLEVFNHTNDASAAQRAMDQELRPSTDPARPSIYRVDMSPVAVPYLMSNGETEGVQRAFEAYAIYPQDNGLLYLNESVLGLYMHYCLPETGDPEKVYTRTDTDAGDLRVFNASELDIANLIPATNPGEFSQRDPAPAPGTLPTYAEGIFGITVDSANVPTNRIGLATRDFNPGSSNPAMVRVEEGKQYKVRWHVVSTQDTNKQSQLRLRARSIKFAYSQKFEIGGAWATGGTTINANNSIAQQALPGVGTQNPDRYTTDTQGGWYTMLMCTPMAKDIRPEFAESTPLATRMPNICGQPGPGVDAASRRDVRLGCDLLDTLSAGTNRNLEKGRFTIDRIEVRVYDIVPD